MSFDDLDQSRPNYPCGGGPTDGREATEHALVWLSGLDLGADLLVVSAQGPWASMNTISFDPIGVRERRCVVWIRGPPNYATNRYGISRTS